MEVKGVFIDKDVLKTSWGTDDNLRSLGKAGLVLALIGFGGEKTNLKLLEVLLERTGEFIDLSSKLTAWADDNGLKTR